MPVPQPEQGEAKKDFISRCIRVLTEEDPNKPKEEISAICYDQWQEKGSTAKSLYDELTERFSNISNFLTTHFGKRGEALLNFTLTRIGAFDPKSQKLNLAALKGDFDLPYMKTCEDGSVEVGNLVLAYTEFAKIDSENHTVSGYVNTVSCDVYDDIFLPEAYEDSLKENYLEKGNPIYFMHHTDIAAGKLLSLKFDEVGAYAETKPYDSYWQLFEDGTLKGFSVGGSLKLWPDVVGRAWVSHKKYALTMPDISYVTRPANMLSYYDGIGDAESEKRVSEFVSDKSKPMKQKSLALKAKLVKSDSKSQTDRTPTKTGNKTKKENENLSQEETEQKHDVELSEEQRIINAIKEMRKGDKKEALKSVLEAMQTERAKELKLQEEDRIGKLEKQFGEYKGELSVTLAELKKSVEALTGKITKIEDAPEYKKVAPDAKDERKVVAVTSLSAALEEAGVA